MSVKVQETLIKYLSGLLDADGSLSFKFNTLNEGFRVGLELSLTAAESVDREGKFVKSLTNLTGFGFITSRTRENWSTVNEWRVVSSRDLNMLIPRLTKHMVIKGKHWNNLFNFYRDLQGKILSQEEVSLLKEVSKQSRKNVGPLKPKNHPTWAWTAGYIDGDGCLSLKNHPSGYGKKVSVSVTSHKDDRIGIDLLFKAFSGQVYDRNHDNCCEWKRNLGVRDKAFAISFLTKLVNHSKLKKYKIEQMLAYLHSTNSQRLTEKNSTE
jgi:hypothetical protein